MHIEPVICNGHLPYWLYTDSVGGRREWGVGYRGLEISEAKCLLEEGLQAFHLF